MSDPAAGCLEPASRGHNPDWPTRTVVQSQRETYHAVLAENAKGAARRAGHRLRGENMRLYDYLRQARENPNLWWTLDSGQHLGLFEQLMDIAVDALDTAIQIMDNYDCTTLSQQVEEMRVTLAQLADPVQVSSGLARGHDERLQEIEQRLDGLDYAVANLQRLAQQQHGPEAGL